MKICFKFTEFLFNFLDLLHCPTAIVRSLSLVRSPYFIVVETVSDNWVPEILEMHPDLVCSSRFNSATQYGSVFLRAKMEKPAAGSMHSLYTNQLSNIKMTQIFVLSCLNLLSASCPSVRTHRNPMWWLNTPIFASQTTSPLKIHFEEQIKC